MKKGFLIILFVLAIFSMFLDKRISLFFNSASPVLAFISVWSINIINSITISVLTVLITKKRQWRIVIPTFLSLGFLFVIAKFLIARARPFQVLDLVSITGIDYGFASWNSSFPSWHIATLAMLIPFIGKNKAKIAVIYSAIVLIAFSRLFAGVHYLSDVLFGFLAGLLVGELAIYSAKRLQKTNLFKEI